MPHQVAVTVHATIDPPRQAELAALLDRMRLEGAARNGVLPFADLDGVHFARLFVLDATADLSGAPIPAALVYMADVDAPVHRHLRALATEHGAGCDAVFGCCTGYPDRPNPGLRMAWLLPRLVAPAATYVHRIGRTVEQVRDEDELWERLESMLDLPDSVPDRVSAGSAHEHIRTEARSRDDLRWARRRARGPGIAYRVRDVLHLVLPPVALLVLWPLLVPAVLVLLLLVRAHEQRDRAERGPAPPALVHELEATEDHAAQNPFTAVGFVKPGLVRRLTIRGVLFGLDWFNRHVYGRDNLAGVRTIHFARWVPLDGYRRLVFASSYDGTLESYMDDFIDRLAWGLNAVFSNGVGYPDTRWLLLGGARDETAFKNYLRNHQVVTPVWYSAYDTLPARNIDDHTRLRDGLSRTLDEPAADEWLALL